MFPVILKIGPLTLHSYGLLFAIAVLVCAFLLSREARSLGMDSALIYDFVFWVILSGIVGARIFYILLNVPFFIQHPLEIIMIQNGGLAWQGGLILASITGITFIQKRNLPLLKMADLVAPYIALGQSIGRIGCFLNGCCFGKEVSWGIYFPVHNARLHPTQLYDSIGLLIIFFILKTYQKFYPPLGQVFIMYLILASVLRFGIEFLRADHRILFFGLSIFQILCLGLILAAFYVHAYLKSRIRK